MIATLTRAHGLTRGQVAAALGVHPNRLADKIAGRQPFRESEILAAAELFRVPPGRLFEDPLELLGVTTSGSEFACTTLALVSNDFAWAA